MIQFKIEQKYKILACNSKETFFKALQRNEEQREVAIKRISFANMNEKEKKNITDQVNLLRNTKRNSNIVRYYDYIVDKAHASLFIVMEYCSGESLEQFLRLNREKGTYIEEKIIWRIFSQIVNAVNQIHNYSQGPILHRDIKPNAILLDKDNNVKLGNFNLKKLNPEEQFSTTYIPGTYYSSPERIKQGIHSKQSDIWALGCLIYEMATLRSPFKKQSQFQTAQSILSDKVQQIPYSKQLNRVMNWCLEKQRKSRPTVTELKSVPLINYRIKQARIYAEKKRTQQKQEQLKEKQLMLKKMQSKIKYLQGLSAKEQNKQNSQMGNWIKNNSSSQFFNYKS